MAEEVPGRRLNSVFFGGGTPSLMPPEMVHSILDRVRTRWGVANDWEVTLEANPGSVEAQRFKGFHQAGVNRVSMGVQALNDGDLKRLGRLHTAAEAMKAFEIARSEFDKVSFDLIYARQHQTLAEWSDELRRALGLAVDHLSLYQLTIEDGTAFGDRHARGRLAGLPDEERSAALYEITQELCDEAGLSAYEVSNHARPGSESVHNLIYWRAGDYVGIGPGAHGRLTLGGKRWATSAPLSPLAWLSQIREFGHGELPREQLSCSEQAVEYLMMSLRLTEGTDMRRLSLLRGRQLDNRAVAELVDLGLIERDEHRIRATAKGRLLLNAIIRRLADSLQTEPSRGS